MTSAIELSLPRSLEGVRKAQRRGLKQVSLDEGTWYNRSKIKIKEVKSEEDLPHETAPFLGRTIQSLRFSRNLYSIGDERRL
jgi:hypothetical protein